ncbi:MAG TPA: hypothetical protein VF705_00250, partial [Longimicrobium sp.]
MGSDLWLEADVLHPGARAHVRPREHRYVLHPVWVYRVFARPRVSEPLNPLQRAVLGLCAAGVRQVDQIGARLGLHPQLVGFIALQLDDRGLLGRGSMEPSPRGHQALAGALMASETALLAELFQDAWTGELLACSLDRPASAEVTRAKGRVFRLEVGTRGKPVSVRALALPPSGVPVPAAPEPGAILPLLRAVCATGALEGGHAGTRVDFSHVSLVEAPRQALVTTLVYTPHKAAEGAGWFVADPFRPGVDRRLRKFLEARLEADAELAEWLRPVVEGAPDPLDSAGGDGDGLAQARARVWARVGEVLNGREDLLDALAAFEAAHARETREDARRLTTGITELREHGARVLAEILATLADDWRTDALADTLPERDREHRDSLVDAAARAIGAAEPPRALLNVPPAELRAACDAGEGGLPALLLAAVLAAQRMPDHPLRGALARDPLLLATLLSQAADAGQGLPAPRSPRREIDHIHQSIFRSAVLLTRGLPPAGV